MITGNIAIRFLENPYLKQFFHKIRPSFKPPSRRQFMNLLELEYQNAKSAVDVAINYADFIALTSDGWTDVSSNRLINIIVHLPRPCFYSTIESTMEAHTGKHICKLIAEQIESIGQHKVVALITDNAPNMKAAWKLLSEKFPWMLFEECKMHALDLAAKDFLKHSFVSDFVSNCIDIAKFFR
jgi:hypothetical protein